MLLILAEENLRSTFIVPSVYGVFCIEKLAHYTWRSYILSVPLDGSSTMAQR